MAGMIPDSLGNLHEMSTLCVCSQIIAKPSCKGKLFALLRLFSPLVFLSLSLTASFTFRRTFCSDLQSNSLNGTIPNQLGNCTKLESLTLSNNRLTGSVPDDLSHCTYMRYLYLDNNGLTGDIPDSFGKFKYINTLDIQSNGLTGDIPSSLGDLASLKRLALKRNAFNGFVPESFCNILPHLFYCGLAWEKSPFKCPLPACSVALKCGATCK